jgi:hypothetical protein
MGEHKLQVFENRVLRRISGQKRDEVTEEWRRLHNKKPYNLYSPNIIRVIKPRRMTWVRHVGIWERGDVHTGFWRGDPRERNHLEHISIDGRII